RDGSVDIGYDSEFTGPLYFYVSYSLDGEPKVTSVKKLNLSMATIRVDEDGLRSDFMDRVVNTFKVTDGLVLDSDDAMHFIKGGLHAFNIVKKSTESGSLVRFKHSIDHGNGELTLQMRVGTDSGYDSVSIEKYKKDVDLFNRRYQASSTVNYGISSFYESMFTVLDLDVGIGIGLDFYIGGYLETTFGADGKDRVITGNAQSLVSCFKYSKSVSIPVPHTLGLINVDIGSVYDISLISNKPKEGSIMGDPDVNIKIELYAGISVGVDVAYAAINLSFYAKINYGDSFWAKAGLSLHFDWRFLLASGQVDLLSGEMTLWGNPPSYRLLRMSMLSGTGVPDQWDYGEDAVHSIGSADSSMTLDPSGPVMVFMTEDGLDYIWFDGGAWSKPKGVHGLGGIDMGPRLFTVSDTTYLLWSNLEPAFGTDAAESLDDYASILNSYDLCIATWDPESKSFSQPFRVTDGNGRSEEHYSVIDCGGISSIVWLENEYSPESDSFGFQTGGTLRIQTAAVGTGGVPSAPETHAMSLGISERTPFMVTGFEAYNGTDGSLAYVASYAEDRGDVSDDELRYVHHIACDEFDRTDMSSATLFNGDTYYTIGDSLYRAGSEKALYSGIFGAITFVSDGVNDYICWAEDDRLCAAVLVGDEFYGPLCVYSTDGYSGPQGDYKAVIDSFNVIVDDGGLRYSCTSVDKDGVTSMAVGFFDLGSPPSIRAQISYIGVDGSISVDAVVENQSGTVYDDDLFLRYTDGEVVMEQPLSLMPGESEVVNMFYNGALDALRTARAELLAGNNVVGTVDMEIDPAVDLDVSVSFMDEARIEDSMYFVSADVSAANASGLTEEFHLYRVLYDVVDGVWDRENSRGAEIPASKYSIVRLDAGDALVKVPFDRAIMGEDRIVNLELSVEFKDGTETVAECSDFFMLYNFELVTVYADMSLYGMGGKVQQDSGYPGDPFPDWGAKDLSETVLFTGYYVVKDPRHPDGYVGTIPGVFPEYNTTYTAVYVQGSRTYSGECSLEDAVDKTYYTIYKDEADREITLTIYGTGSVNSSSWSTDLFGNNTGAVGLYEEGYSLSVVFMEGVRSIDTNAFFDRPEITSVSIASTITHIEPGAFEACPNIQRFDTAQGIPTYAAYGGMLFRHVYLGEVGGLELLYCPESAIDDGRLALPAFTIPVSDGSGVRTEELKVIRIGDRALYARGITEAVLPDVMEIGDHAFAHCGSLEAVSCPSIVSIGGYAFQGCSSLTGVGADGVNLGQGLREIGEGAFAGCDSVSSVRLDSGSALQEIGDHAFQGCSHLSRLSLPVEGSVSIGTNAFSFTALRTVEITAAVSSISGSFYGCESLESFTSPDSDGARYRADGGVLYELLPDGTYRLVAFPPKLGSSVIVIGSDVSDVAVGALSGIASIERIELEGGESHEHLLLDRYGILYKRLGDGRLELILCPSGAELGGPVVIGEGSSCAIRSSAFVNVGSLTDVTIVGASEGSLGGVYEIEAGAFTDDLCLKAVRITSKTGAGSCIAIHPAAFTGCRSIESMEIPRLTLADFYDRAGDCLAVTEFGMGAGTSKLYVGEDRASWGHLLDSDAPSIFVSDGDVLRIVGYARIAIDPSGGYIDDAGWTRDYDGKYVRWAVKGETVELPEVHRAGSGWYEYEFVPWGEGSVIADEDVELKATFETTFEVSVGDRFLYQGLMYEVTGLEPRTAAVVGYEGTMKNLSVPSSAVYKGMSLDVTTIGQKAFYHCTTLISADLGSVSKVDVKAFAQCTKLKTVHAGDSLSTISAYAFASCVRLVDFDLGGSLKTLKVIGSYAFLKDAKLGGIAVPSFVATVGEGAFAMPFSDENGNDLAADAASLAGYEYVNLDGTLVRQPGVELGREFSWNGLTLTVTASLPAEAGISGYSGKPRSLVLSGPVELEGAVYDITSVMKNAFNGCKTLVSADLPGIERLDAQAFYGCSKLESVSAPDLVSVGTKAFARCTALSDIDLGDSLTTISAYGFWGCTSLESVTLPDTVRSLGTYAFQRCSSLSSIDLGESLRLIGSKAFDGTAVVSLDIPDTIVRLKEGALSGCPELREVSFEGGEKVILHAGVFEGDTNIERIAMPDGFKRIYAGALDGITFLDGDGNPLAVKARILAGHVFAGEGGQLILSA
ncbi:MAG: leucine-rich repeat protein, partial [Candidatus Methanomethylophilaceae archaeon]|nr:leucine-rich repeat protein [Candidatus Methanomethylophilaceae archaeon]